MEDTFNMRLSIVPDTTLHARVAVLLMYILLVLRGGGKENGDGPRIERGGKHDDYVEDQIRWKQENEKT